MDALTHVEIQRPMSWGDHFYAARSEYWFHQNFLVFLGVFFVLFFSLAILKLPAYLAWLAVGWPAVYQAVVASWRYVRRRQTCRLRLDEQNIIANGGDNEGDTICTWSNVDQVRRNKDSVTFSFKPGWLMTVSKIRAQDLPPGVGLDDVYAFAEKQWKAGQAAKHELGECKSPIPLLQQRFDNGPENRR